MMKDIYSYDGRPDDSLSLEVLKRLDTPVFGLEALAFPEHEDQQSQLRRNTHTETPSSGKVSPKYQTRVSAEQRKRRIIMHEEIADVVDLHKIKPSASPADFAQVFFDTIQVHKILHDYCGIIHGDINPHTVQVKRKGDGVSGILMDFDDRYDYDLGHILKRELEDKAKEAGADSIWSQLASSELIQDVLRGAIPPGVTLRAPSAR